MFKDEKLEEGVTEEIPTFTPPAQSEEEIPTFTPPPPGKSTVPKCYKHSEEEAVATCAHCGKNICKDCAESCQVTGGGYDGQYLCYDCSRAIFEEDETKIKKDRSKIIFKFALFIIGILIGASLGASDGPFMALIAAMIGGSFLSALKPLGSALADMFKGVFQLGFGNILEAIINILVAAVKFLIVVVQCTIRNVIKLISYINYLIKANKALNETRAALRQLDDFMEYMSVRAANHGMDLDALVGEGGELANNEYARVLRESGEAAADEMLRRATTTIAENGEIIRNFVVE